MEMRTEPRGSSLDSGGWGMNELETRTKTRGNRVQPVLALNRVTFQYIRVRLQTETHGLLKEYITFYQETAGETPVESELVEAALNRAFKKDKAFQEFLRKKGEKGATSKGSSKQS